MNKLTDIKETDFGLDNVISYRIDRGKGSAGETFEIHLSGLVSDYGAGDYVPVKGFSGFITQREYAVSSGEYTTILRGVSVVADVLRKAPKENLMFMSMTPSEHDDFTIANTGSDGKVDFDELDYIPLIKICDAKTLIGGWHSREVVKYLANLMGLSVVYNAVGYWLRQVRADIQSSFFDTIMSIVSFLEPLVYVENGVLYIINNPVRNGTIDLGNITQFSQRETFNYSSKMSLLRVDGGLGQWNQAMEKGVVASERTVVLEYESVRESAQMMKVTLSGDVVSTTRQQGKGTYDIPKETVSNPAPGTYEYSVEMQQPKEDRDNRTETVLLDPWGNIKAQLATHEKKTFINPIDNTELPVFEATTEYEYDFLSEMYERPRETRQVHMVTEWTWEIASFPGYPYRQYKTKTKVIERIWIYAPNGVLLCELETHKADVLKLSADLTGLYAGMITYIELNVADMLWLETSETAQIVTDETEIRYRQVTPNTYEKAIFRRRNAGLRRKQGDELRSHEVQTVVGRVPRRPAKFRRTQVYAQQTIGEESQPTGGGMEVPALVISNPNVIDWQDAQAILSEAKRRVSNKQSNIERTYVFAGDIDIDVGWGALLGEVLAFGDKVGAIAASEISVVGWSKSKDAPGVAVMTTITIEGKQT